MYFQKSYRQQLYLQRRQEVHIFIENQNDAQDDAKKKQNSNKIPPEDADNCAIKKIIWIGSLLKFLPFCRDPQSGKIILAQSKDRTLVNVNLAWIFSYVGIKLYFLVFRQLTNHANCNKVSYSIFGSLFFIMFGLAFLLHLNNVINLEDIACTVNTYCQRIRGHLGDIFQIRKSIALLDLLWSVYIIILHILLALSIPLFIRNKSNLSLYRYFGGTDWRICFLFLLIDYYSLYAFTVIVGFYVFLIVDCAAVVEKLSKHMTVRIQGITQICLSTQRIQELRYLQRCCNEIQIAFVSYKSIMEPLVLPLFLAVATILSSLGLFTVIKFFGELGIFFSMVLSLGESLCISVTSLGLCKASSICDNSELLQKELCHLSLVPKRNRHELKVIMKCIRPIRFRIGSFFPVSKQTATDFLETLCSWLTTLLLTYG